MQIFDTHPNDVGMHWICFSKFNCDDDAVNLYDRAGGTYISSAAEMAIANMMFSPMPKIFVRYFKCSVQTNTNDCVKMLTIANMVSIFSGIHSNGITYTVSKMRDHLIKGFENQNITVYYQLCFIVGFVMCLLPVMING